MSRGPSAPSTPSLIRRLDENPLITPADVRPSLPALEVVSVFNAAAARVGDDIVLLLRVAERPRTDIEPPAGAMTLDLEGPEPVLLPLPPGRRADELVGMCFLDAAADPVSVVVAYLPRDLPGLDLSDPRTIRYTRAGPMAEATLGRRGEMRSSRKAHGTPVDYLSQMSHLRVARSTDGVHFTVDERPAMAPLTHLEEYGIEDPRATLIDGTWQITYVSVARLGITTSRATTTDFRTFGREGLIFLPDHKDVAIFPGRVGGRYVALTRPMPQSFSRVCGIWIAFSDDLDTWGEHEPLALPRWQMWDEVRTGASAVPFLTSEGWLELYHGVDRHARYAMGALLLDADDPSIVIARSSAPFLTPEAPYERVGLFADTVFSCGHVELDDDRIRLYYGAADSVVAAADLSVKGILASLREC